MKRNKKKYVQDVSKFNKEIKKYTLNWLDNQDTEPYVELLERLMIEFNLERTTAIALCMHMAESEINKQLIQEILDANILIPNPNLTKEEEELYTWDIMKDK